MTDFGITPDGFRLKTLRDVLAEIGDDQKSEISPTIDLTPESPDGQRNGIAARQHASTWEALAMVEEALDPDKAEDARLVSLCKLTGTVPRGESASEVSCDCTLTSGTVLTPDVHYANVTGKPDILWTPTAPFTAPSTGTHAVRFRCTQLGPVAANAGTLNVISVGTSGWTVVTNTLDARRGRPADTNESLRERREQELAAAGSGSVAGIRADLLRHENTDGERVIADCFVFENVEDKVSVDGLPPHSVECVIVDDPTQANDVLAQAVWEAVDGGIATHGNTTATATDEGGKTHSVRFSRPVDRNVWLIYDLETNADYAGDSEFAVSVAQALRTVHRPGLSVLRAVCEREAWNTPGIINILSVKLGFAASPTGTADLPIAIRERPAFDSTRITRT
jgi:hypothetical protein